MEQQFQQGIAPCATAFGEKAQADSVFQNTAQNTLRGCSLPPVKWGFPADSQCVISESGITDAHLTSSLNCCKNFISLQPLFNTPDLCYFLSHSGLTFPSALTGSNSHCTCPTPGQAFPSRKNPAHKAAIQLQVLKSCSFEDLKDLIITGSNIEEQSIICLKETQNQYQAHVNKSWDGHRELQTPQCCCCLQREGGVAAVNISPAEANLLI